MGIRLFFDLSHVIFVKSYDVDWNIKLGSVKNDDSKKKINLFINKIFCHNIQPLSISNKK